MGKIKRGDPIRARDLNRYGEGAERLADLLPGPGIDITTTPGGMSLSQVFVPTRFPIGSRVTNDEAADIPAGSIIQITGVYNEYCLEGKQPDNERAERIGINPLQIADGSIGKIVLAGIVYLEVKVGAGETFAAGDRVGAKDGQWEAQVDEGGPIIIEELIDAIPAPGGNVTCIGRLGESVGIPYAYKTTAAPAAGTVTAKRVDSTGAVQGDNITFVVW